MNTAVHNDQVLPAGTPTQAWINGEFTDASDGGLFPTYAPGTGKKIANVAACGPDDVDRAVSAARNVFELGTWRDLPPRERKSILLRFASLLEQNLSQLSYLDSVNAGKTLTDCEQFDLPDVVECVRWYAESIDKVFGKVSPTSSDSLGLVVREPVGVVGIVLPWNFPAAMLAWKMAPALAAGNSLVIKPAELSPLSALRIAELAGQAGIPPGVFNVVPGLGEVTGKAIGLHMGVDVVTFTGSAEVGRYFLEYSAASNLKQIVLECGGKSPQIVMPDMADHLDLVVDDLVQAAFTNAGQNCTAGSRVLVHSSIKAELVRKLTAAAQSVVTGDPLDRTTQMGPLIEESARKRVLEFVAQARDDGAVICCGGASLDVGEGGWYVSPTVIDRVTPGMAVAREEIFGPVVSVMCFDTHEEAIVISNSLPYGLAATVWCDDITIAVRMARSIRAGTVAINGYSEGDISTPFGGYKQSGFGGRDKGLEAFDQYTELKTIWLTLR